LLAVAAVLWLAAVAVPARASGAGSAISGHALADLIAAGTLGSLAPRWLGTVWYAMPLAGAVVLATLAFERPLLAWSRVGVAALGAGSALLCSAALTGLRPARFGAGTWCALGGSLAALAAIATAVRGALEVPHAAR
jgi:hypothetical protein